MSPSNRFALVNSDGAGGSRHVLLSPTGGGIRGRVNLVQVGVRQVALNRRPEALNTGRAEMDKETASIPLLLGIIAFLLACVAGMIGYFGLSIQGDIDKIEAAERVTSDAVKDFQLEVAKGSGEINRRLDAIVVRMDGITATLATRP